MLQKGYLEYVIITTKVHSTLTTYNVPFKFELASLMK
jgi:hypothetical protein